MGIRRVRIALFTFIAGVVLCSPIRVGAQINLRYAKVRMVRSLSAKIVDPIGNPVVGATVEEMDGDWREVSRTTKTDGSGKFTFETIRGRKIYYIRVRAKNFQPIEFPLKVNFMHWKTLKLTMPVGT
jgi:hypothetical protein